MISLRMLVPSVQYHRLLVLREIWRDSKATMRSLGRAAGVSAVTVCLYMQQLRAHQIVEVTGSTNRTTRYALTARGELTLADLENRLEEDLLELATVTRGRRA